MISFCWHTSDSCKSRLLACRSDFHPCKKSVHMDSMFEYNKGPSINDYTHPGEGSEIWDDVQLGDGE